MTAILKVLYSIVLVIISPFLIAGMGLVSCLGLDSCGAEPPNEEWVELNFDLQLDGATVEEAWDTHGGFHGDGNTYIELSLAESIEDQILAINTEYVGKTKGGPWYVVGEFPQSYAGLLDDVRDHRDGGGTGEPIPIEVTNGYFCVINRFDGKEEYVWIEEDNFFGSFWNYTFAIYDADALKLYYYESDM